MQFNIFKLMSLFLRTALDLVVNATTAIQNKTHMENCRVLLRFHNSGWERRNLALFVRMLWC